MRILTRRFAHLCGAWWGVMVKAGRAFTAFALRRMDRAMALAERMRAPK